MKTQIIKPLAFSIGLIFGSSLLGACNENSNTATTGDNQSATETGTATENTTVTDKIAAPIVNNTLTFIHMNDLHAHLTSHYDWVKTDVNSAPKLVKAGGIARIASAIDSIRASNPNNTVLMNIGDTYHGGAEALYTNGNAVVDIMNKLNVDIGVPGNWDYAYGFNATRARFSTAVMDMPMTEGEIRKVNYPNLAANVTSKLMFPKFLDATKILTINGAKVGFIGLSSDMVPKMHTMMAMSFDFLQGDTNYINLINSLSQQLRNQGANVVVVMSELGIHKDLWLADRISTASANRVDVIFSAHTHELTRSAIATKSGALVVEAGNDIYLGKMNIKLTNGQIANRATDLSWSVVTVNETYPERSDIADMVAAVRNDLRTNYIGRKVPMMMMEQRLDHDIEEVIGHTSVTLDRRQALENNFNRAFTTMLKNYAKTDIAMTPGFRYDSVIPGTDIPVEDEPMLHGNITVEDMYRYFPMPFTLSTATIPARGSSGPFGFISITGFNNIIENNLTSVFSSQAFNQVGGWTDGFAGLDLKVNLKNADGARITSMKLAGSSTELTSSKTLTVAGCSRPMDDASTLCSYSGFNNVTPLYNPATGSAWYGVEFAINQIQTGKLTSQFSGKVTDTSNTAMWPNSMYVQPLYGAK